MGRAAESRRNRGAGNPNAGKCSKPEEPSAFFWRSQPDKFMDHEKQTEPAPTSDPAVGFSAGLIIAREIPPFEI
jgi:hypothetical protein